MRNSNMQRKTGREVDHSILHAYRSIEQLRGRYEMLDRSNRHVDRGINPFEAILAEIDALEMSVSQMRASSNIALEAKIRLLLRECSDSNDEDVIYRLALSLCFDLLCTSRFQKLENSPLTGLSAGKPFRPIRRQSQRPAIVTLCPAKPPIKVSRPSRSQDAAASEAHLSPP